MRLVRKNAFRLQYRLATLFVLIAVFSIPLGYWASRERAYRERQAAVEVILHGSEFPYCLRALGDDDIYLDSATLAPSFVVSRGENVQWVIGCPWGRGTI